MDEKSIKKAGVLGAGAWGTAMAAVCARAKLETTIWAFEKEVVENINQRHENRIFLPEISLPKSLAATNNMEVLEACDFILLVVPVQFTRSILEKLPGNFPSRIPLVICSKGIETKTGQLVSEIVREVRPDNPVLVLSGPSFAADVGKGKPVAVTIAGEDQKMVEAIGTSLGQPAFRPYWSDDIIGAQIGGAVKNVLAIACGISEGKGLGTSARAALITRGMSEMIQFAKAKGADAETLMGLCGLGDTVLTCTSTMSRNMSLGKAIGEGQTMKDILAKRKSVAEGAYTSKVIVKLARDMNVEMPICAAVYEILHKDADVDKTIHGLLTRPYGDEDL